MYKKKPFDWIRGYQVGGKSIMWARQVQRWSNLDFEGPARDDFAVDWPIRYNDLEKWYSYVEKFVGVSGNKDGLEILPDGEFLKPWDSNCVHKPCYTSLVTVISSSLFSSYRTLKPLGRYALPSTASLRYDSSICWLKFAIANDG